MTVRGRSGASRLKGFDSRDERNNGVVYGGIGIYELNHTRPFITREGVCVSVARSGRRDRSGSHRCGHPSTRSTHGPGVRSGCGLLVISTPRSRSSPAATQPWVVSEDQRFAQSLNARRSPRSRASIPSIVCSFEICKLATASAWFTKRVMGSSALNTTKAQVTQPGLEPCARWCHRRSLNWNGPRG